MCSERAACANKPPLLTETTDGAAVMASNIIYDTDVNTRTCIKCGEAKPIENYGVHGDWRQTTCKPCLAAKARERRSSKEYRDAENARVRKRYAEARDRLRALSFHSGDKLFSCHNQTLV